MRMRDDRHRYLRVMLATLLALLTLPGAGLAADRDDDRQVVTGNVIPVSGGMEKFRIVAPVQGTSHSVLTKDFLGQTVPVLRELPSTDPRFQQLKGYIESDRGLRKVMAMHLQARQTKLEQLQTRLNSGTQDPALTKWLIQDLKKPVYLEVGDSGGVYHDPKGFVLAEQQPNGQVAYRDHSYANRLVVPPNNEVFHGGMKDSAAASVIAHETGHMIMDQLYETPNYPKSNYAGPHAKNSVTDPGFAFSEGWAEAIETLANSDRLDNPTSWRLKTQKNIVENKYIFKNQGVIDGVNDGILKNGAQQMSTEGVNATLFYRMLQNHRIQMPYEKVCQVFMNSKPQNYVDFVESYIQQFPEDRSTVIKQFLDTTKYTTVDPSATARYKAVHDAEQAMRSAEGSERYAQAAEKYRQLKADFDATNETLYKQAVVDGRVDSAVGKAAVANAGNIDKQFVSTKIGETVSRAGRALTIGWNDAKASIKQSFSVKNVAMTAGISIGVNLASQVLSGEKVSIKKAFSAIASAQFVGNVVGSSLGAAAGHVVAPLVQAFVPIPIVGAIAGSLIPTMASIAGGQFGSNLGAKMTLKEAFKSLDPVAIAGQAIGSSLGAMLGSMIPIPYVGTILGGMIGGVIGQKVFTKIASWFGRKPKTAGTPATTAPQTQAATPASTWSQYQAPATAPPKAAADVQKVTPPAPKADPGSEHRLPPSLDRIPYGQMHPNLRKVKDDYEKAYQAYVQALGAGQQAAAQSQLEAFIAQRERYRRALGAYIK